MKLWRSVLCLESYITDYNAQQWVDSGVTKRDKENFVRFCMQLIQMVEYVEMDILRTESIYYSLTWPVALTQLS